LSTFGIFVIVIFCTSVGHVTAEVAWHFTPQRPKYEPRRVIVGFVVNDMQQFFSC
jgi:hypothetical protein